MKQRPPSSCPVCGEEVPRNARACPECGACDKSGWSADTATDGLDLRDEEFDYDEFAAEEFGSGTRMSGRQRLWWIVAVVLLIALAMLFFGLR